MAVSVERLDCVREEISRYKQSRSVGSSMSNSCPENHEGVALRSALRQCGRRSLPPRRICSGSFDFSAFIPLS